MKTLKERQIHAIKQMLNLNQPQNQQAETVWKLLIYDKVGQDIISPLLSIKELRELGVTLHMQLHSDRDLIPEMPAVYFCVPNDENLGRISQDFQNSLYDMYHINFISPISREKLENLAEAAVHWGCVANVQKVFDQYVNFISLEDDLFVLKHQRSDQLSYYAINQSDVKDTQMEEITNAIVDGLFSACVTLGNVPIIRSQKGNVAEMVANKLDTKLRDNVFDARNNLFSMDATQVGSFSFQRPLLIILDRNIDIATPLHHTWTYQALAHDVLDLSLNRVTVEDKEAHGGARAKTKTCDLDANDAFWMTQKGSPFPTVAEAIQEELERYRACEDEIKRLKSAMGVDNDSELPYVTDNTARLTSAVNSLPQLLEKKRLLDMHTTIATGILNSIKSRRLDTFFELEEKIMSKTTLDKSLVDFLNDSSAGTPEDKMRLFLIYFICVTNMSDGELSAFERALDAQGCDKSPLVYLKQWKSFTKMLATPINQYEGGGTRTVNMFSKLVTQGSSFVMEGVKNLVVKRHNLPVTKVVDQLMEGKIADKDDYLYLDPKQHRKMVVPRAKTVFNDAIVFVVGGGNYIEYQNLADYAKQKAGTGSEKRIIYGATTLVTANQFLKQLSLLGMELTASD